MSDIKNFKPSKTSKYRQDYFTNAKKYSYKNAESPEPIIYRSSWERQFMISLEMNPLVKSWSSESVKIPYILPETINGKIEQKRHNYFPDFCVLMNDGRRFLIEVKPRCQCPKIEQDINRNKTLQKNAYKWKYALQWCKINGYEFKVVTEDAFTKNFLCGVK